VLGNAEKEHLVVYR